MLYTPPRIRIGQTFLDFSQPLIMGVINLTDDSFYAGSRLIKPDAVIQRMEDMKAQGADLIDLGAMSSRPGAELSTPQEELERLVPVLDTIPERFQPYISIDTIHSEVAKTCVEHGAHIINDVSGGRLDNQMWKTVADLEVPYILMHMRGTPSTMQKLTDYPNGVAADVLAESLNALKTAREAGIKDIIMDPGFGFSKTIRQNFELLRNLRAFRVMDAPVLVGVSRKSMIWRTLGVSPDEALNGTTVLNTLALENGANILRVHDVKEAVECRTIWSNYCTSYTSDQSQHEKG